MDTGDTEYSFEQIREEKEALQRYLKSEFESTIEIDWDEVFKSLTRKQRKVLKLLSVGHSYIEVERIMFRKQTNNVAKIVATIQKRVNNKFGNELPKKTV